MRLPFVQFPNIVIESLAYFAPVFQTDEQVKHFCEYVTGLIAGDRKTVSAINILIGSGSARLGTMTSILKFLGDTQVRIAHFPCKKCTGSEQKFPTSPYTDNETRN